MTRKKGRQETSRQLALYAGRERPDGFRVGMSLLRSVTEKWGVIGLQNLWILARGGQGERSASGSRGGAAWVGLKGG
jgi:hypothetical protein